MMFFLFILPIGLAFSCETVSFQGELRHAEKRFTLVVNAGTLSEKKIAIARKEEMKFLPYEGKFLKGRGDLVRGELRSASKLDFALPDGESYLKEDCQ